MAENNTITIKLGEEKITLKPSMQAMRMISRQYNGLANARAALVQESFDAVAFVIRIGSGMKEREARELDEKVYRAGILGGDLLMQLINYVAMLGNRGQPIQLTDNEDKEEQETGYRE